MINLDKTAKKHRFLPQSIKKRMILLLFCSMILPVILMAVLMLYQMLSLYHEKVDTSIQQELSQSVDGISSLIENMQSMSQQLIADGYIGQNLYSYFDPEVPVTKLQFLKYLDRQIAIYESSNPNIANITYFYVSNSNLTPEKINQASLTRRKLPDESIILSHQNEINYYGPHKTYSFVSDYPVISLVRKFEGKGNLTNIYIYIETGYRKLEKLLPQSVQTMKGTFLIISDSNLVLYSSNEDIVPMGVYMSDTDDAYKPRGDDYVSFSQESGKRWSARLLIPNKKYYDHIYTLGINYGIIALIVAAFCIFVEYIMWKSIYKPFKLFDRNLKQIVNDENVQLQVRHMDVEEFEENFAYFKKLKKSIVELLDKVQQEENKRAELQIKQLLSKINPHFICNTLDTLKWYAKERHENEIVEFVSALNKLLLYNLERTPETTLQSETSAIEDYVALQRWKYDIDFQINKEDLPPFMLCAKMPRFVLQPLVENAILHSGNTSCKIRLVLSLQEDGRIAIVVNNSGIPFDIDKVENMLSSSTDISQNGIGLQYVAKMFNNQFGEKFSFNIKNSELEGNSITLSIPFIPAKGGDRYDSCIHS